MNDITAAAPNQINILVVDDYPANLTALRAVLSDPCYRVFEASSGLEALRIAQQSQISLILLDIQMPDIDGYEVARQLRANAATKEIPIIFITSVYREDPYVKRGYEAGGQDYIGKPVDPDILKAKVRVYSSLFLKTASLEHEKRQIQDIAERYRLIVEGAQEIIATIDATGAVTWLNKSFEGLTGHKAAEWLGRSFFHLVEPAELSGVLARFEETARSKTSRISKATIRAACGRAIPVEITAQPLLKDGHVMGAVGVIRDISARVETEVPALR